MNTRFIFLWPLLVAAVSPSVVSGAALYNISLDTTALIGNAAGPFLLDFQFTDGSGTDDGNNSVTVNNFTFGGGATTGAPITIGSVSGDVGSGFTLTDSTFLNELAQGFIPGVALGFTVNLTANLDPWGVPDEFSFAILDNVGAQIPTLGPFDTILLGDINSSNPALHGFASDPSRPSQSSGAPISLPAPTGTSQVPEPTLGLIVGACLVLIVCVRLRSSAPASK